MKRALKLIFAATAATASGLCGAVTCSPAYCPAMTVGAIEVGFDSNYLLFFISNSDAAPLTCSTLGWPVSGIAIDKRKPWFQEYEKILLTARATGQKIAFYLPNSGDCVVTDMYLTD